jgi:hypothetical protein
MDTRSRTRCGKPDGEEASLLPWRGKRSTFSLAALLAISSGIATAADLPDSIKMERLAIDDAEDVSDWYNGSPDETRISASDLRAKQGRAALEFANVVDHTKGEPKYPIGWPRTGKDLEKLGLSDWSDYEFFECWIYATTNRESLPKTPLGVGFYHSGPRRSTSFPLMEVCKDKWTRISIPISKIELPGDVRRVQFNISESNYAHGDQVNFYIDDIVLTRVAHPVIGRLDLRRRVVYTNERHLTSTFELLGNQQDVDMDVLLEIGDGDKVIARTQDANRRLHGEITLKLETGKQLTPGTWWAKLTLRGRDGTELHRRQATFRVIEGPF